MRVEILARRALWRRRGSRRWRWVLGRSRRGRRGGPHAAVFAGVELLTGRAVRRWRRRRRDAAVLTRVEFLAGWAFRRRRRARPDAAILPFVELLACRAARALIPLLAAESAPVKLLTRRTTVAPLVPDALIGARINDLPRGTTELRQRRRRKQNAKHEKQATRPTLSTHVLSQRKKCFPGAGAGPAPTRRLQTRLRCNVWWRVLFYADAAKFVATLNAVTP